MLLLTQDSGLHSKKSTQRKAQEASVQLQQHAPAGCNCGPGEPGGPACTALEAWLYHPGCHKQGAAGVHQAVVRPAAGKLTCLLPRHSIMVYAVRLRSPQAALSVQQRKALSGDSLQTACLIQLRKQSMAVSQELQKLCTCDGPTQYSLTECLCSGKRSAALNL